MNAQSEADDRRIAFEVYRDDAGHSDPDVFAVLTNPGPETPRGAQAAAQDAVVEAFESGELELSDGDAILDGGVVEWDEDNEIVEARVEVEG